MAYADHPIGVQNRKGTLGSYYSVKDFYGINSEFGTMKDFQHLVDEIHAMEMYVIIDWVGNHSAWDNPLRRSIRTGIRKPAKEIFNQHLGMIGMM